MAWTYDPLALGNTTNESRKNSVRLLVGDTDSDDPQVQDEEILFALSENNGNIYGAGAFIASVLMSKFARLVNTELDEAIRADYSDLHDNYKSMFLRLSSKAKGYVAGIKLIATGLTKADFCNADADDNRIKPEIRSKRFDNRRG